MVGNGFGSSSGAQEIFFPEYSIRLEKAFFIYLTISKFSIHLHACVLKICVLSCPSSLFILYSFPFFPSIFTSLRLKKRRAYVTNWFGILLND